MLSDQDLKKMAVVFGKEIEKLRKVVMDVGAIHSREFLELEEKLDRIEHKLDHVLDFLSGEKSTPKPPKPLVH